MRGKARLVTVGLTTALLCGGALLDACRSGNVAGHGVATAPGNVVPASRGKTRPPPFFAARSHPTYYAGPDRELPPPEGVAEVELGWFGPSDARDPATRRMWCAATLAVEEANAGGGYRETPFRLLPVWSENPWGTGIGEAVRLAYRDHLWAFTGAPDGPSAHLLTQVAAKARLPFVSPVATDPTSNLANVPWIFSCAPGDHLHAPVLARAIVAAAAGRPCAIVSCTDHDARVYRQTLLRALARVQAFPALHLEFQPAARDFAAQLDSLTATPPAALIVVAGAADAAGFVVAARNAGLTMPIFGGPWMGQAYFLERAGALAEDVVFPLLWDPREGGQAAVNFADRFRHASGLEPDYTAACTYDSVALLCAAVRDAGLNRARIGDALRALSPWTGVSGTITWDATGQNSRSVGLGTIHNGQVVALPAD
ncbi:MAG TPA: ABC transporter substrate-binding protein [Phycisphaerae bacterium]|nr:ABC transporter substrate-binding protein [Phycisphaerae bacterium]HNU44519.1 ABC transporter substrate-binding protein [Phycisphaerae bacterium]